MQDIRTIAASRIKKFGRAHSAPTTGEIHRDSSLEKPEVLETPEGSNKWNEGNLPEWIWPYVQCRSWAIRFADLLNQGYIKELRDLTAHVTKTAHTNPVHMMAKACSKVRWDESVQQARERMSVERTAQGVRERLGLVKSTAGQLKAIYAAVWRLKGTAMRYAATVQEMRAAKRLKTDAFKFFCWLTSPATVAKERAFYATPYGAR